MIRFICEKVVENMRWNQKARKFELLNLIHAYFLGLMVLYTENRNSNHVTENVNRNRNLRRGKFDLKSSKSFEG